MKKVLILGTGGVGQRHDVTPFIGPGAMRVGGHAAAA